MCKIAPVTKTPLSTAQVAELLGYSVKTVQRKAAAGELPGAVKLPGRTGVFIFDPDKITDYRERTLLQVRHRLARRRIRTGIAMRQQSA